MQDHRWSPGGTFYEGIPPRRGAEGRLGLPQVLGCQNTPFQKFSRSALLRSRPADQPALLIGIQRAPPATPPTSLTDWHSPCFLIRVCLANPAGEQPLVQIHLVLFYCLTSLPCLAPGWSHWVWHQRKSVDAFGWSGLTLLFWIH